MQRTRARVLSRIAAVIAALLCLLLVFQIYASGNGPLAAAIGGFLALGFFIYTARRGYTLRYLFPGLAGIAIFVVLPLLYTVWIGFTNYSSKNLLTFSRATEALLSSTFQRAGAPSFDFTLHSDGAGFRIVLRTPEEEPPAPPSGESAFDFPTGDGSGSAGSGSAGSGAGSAAAAPPAPKPPAAFVSPVLALTAVSKQQVKMVPLEGSGFSPGEPAPIKDIIDRQPALAALTARLPDGTSATMAGLREFNGSEPQYERNEDGSLTDRQTGIRLTPNFDIGFYETPDHKPVEPGFRVVIGGANFERIFTDAKFRGPMLGIFLWTVTYAGLTVLITVALGLLLAELLSWEGLRFRSVYRVLLFLPYAVPSFISILVFKGLFNQNFGELNAVLKGWFGIQPSWTTDPTLAKTMILIVNTWLGYPYFMMLCMGLQKSIPRDLYEASALAGAGPLTNFFKITWPMIRRPLLPLMLASFAFNFNNFSLIKLLTDGRPDYLDTVVPAGETDILATYTYRIAFDSGSNYGLSSAISTMIFVIVAILAIVNLRLTKVTAEEKR